MITGSISRSFQQDTAIIANGKQWAVLIAFLAILLLLPHLPLFSSAPVLGLINGIGVAIIAVTGLQILTGYCGQFSMGPSALVGVGAYTCAILTAKWGWGFMPALLASGFAAALVGFAFGIPSLRVKGFYLALSTIALQFIFVFLVEHGPHEVTGNIDGLQVPTARLPDWLGGMAIDSAEGKYYLILAFVLLGLFLATNLVRTNAGRAFIVVRDNELAAQAIGVNPFRYKLLAFFISSLYAGVAGALYTQLSLFIAPGDFTLTTSIWYVAMLITGGMGTISGVVFGSVLLNVLLFLGPRYGPQLTSVFPQLSDGAVYAGLNLLLALVIILFLVFQPHGVAHWWKSVSSRFSRRYLQ